MPKGRRVRLPRRAPGATRQQRQAVTVDQTPDLRSTTLRSPWAATGQPCGVRQCSGSCDKGEKPRSTYANRGFQEGDPYGVRTRGQEAARNQLARCNPPFCKENLYATLSQGAAQVLASVHGVGTHWAPASRVGSAKRSGTSPSCSPRCSGLAQARAEGHRVQRVIAIASSVFAGDLEQGSLLALGQGPWGAGSRRRGSPSLGLPACNAESPQVSPCRSELGREELQQAVT